MLEILKNYWIDSGFYQFHWTNGVMLLIGLLFIYLAVRRGFEPLLLIPIGFGILIGNIPYDVTKLFVGVYDGPVSENDIHYYQIEIGEVELWSKRGEMLTLPAAMAELKLEKMDYAAMKRLLSKGRRLNLTKVEEIDGRSTALRLLDEGRAIMVNTHSQITLSSQPDGQAPFLVEFRQGRMAFVDEPRASGKYGEVWSLEKQDPWNAGVFWMIFRGIEWGVFPPLIFLGIGALTDFGPLIANPRTILLGAAAQLGIFGALWIALFMGFTAQQASSIGIIGGADGPTAIFVCTKLAPDLLGAVALSAYSYMAMVPLIQPPIMRLLTTKKERLIRMEQPKDVPKSLRVVFPIVGFMLTAFIANGALPLLGMLFFGNLLRESLVTDRLAKTAGSTFIDIVTILLGVSVGAKTNASTFLTQETIKIFILGVIAFSVSTAGGVLFGKLMNWVSKNPVNPLIGAAGVSAVPMAARVVQKVAHEEDPHNFLLMHAMGPNVAGVIGSAVAAGVLLSYFAK
ncbi:MAG: sodium ion-translocating decarboxylase subunit beta [Phycisphaeraceae bacterium]|nr:sodium ion-translocating decarboxylase subunit beta [Phycisphaeraceae bacterium]